MWIIILNFLNIIFQILLQEFLHSNDLELKDDSRMGEDMSLADCRTVVTSTKKSKINSNNSADSETKGQYFYMPTL